jgi:hypothetical protein
MESWTDRADEYEIHAYLFFEFRCTDCGASAPISSAVEVASEQWSEDVARQARVAGWAMPPDKDEIGDVDHRCYCPTCAERREIPPAF